MRTCNAGRRREPCYVAAVRLRHPIIPKCFFVAWIFGWVTAIYVPSFLVTVVGLSPLVGGVHLLSDVFAVADEVAPAAKLAFAILFAGGVLMARRLGGTIATAVHMAIGAIAMFLVIALLPEEWSRGFGIGLTGTRFAALPTAFYLGGGLLSGLAFTISEARCRAPSITPEG